MALTAEQKAVITSTVPILESHGLQITKVFYVNILNEYPTLRSLFSLSNQITDHQAAALAGSVHAYAANINDLTPILPVIESINQKHASLNISESQYGVVGTHLLRALLEVLGRDVFTVQVEEAWAAAYQQLAALMIKREDVIMSKQEAEVGGWKGWRKMKLARKVVESSEITSFYWTPVDGGELPPFIPGQYISIRIDVPVDIPGGQQIRQYSLSDAAPQFQSKPLPVTNGTVHTNGEVIPTKYYRTSIKREEGKYSGLVSNVLHSSHEVGSIVEMSHPAGDFFLDMSPSSQSPLVLISAGVGQTPLVSMLNSLTANGTSSRPITYVHTARNSSIHAFQSRLKSLASSNSHLTYLTFHSQPLPEEIQGRDYDFTGRLNLDKLDAEQILHLNDTAAEYFVCGPGSFMTEVGTWLSKKGVSEDRIKMEVFGVGNISDNAGK